MLRLAGDGDKQWGRVPISEIELYHIYAPSYLRLTNLYKPPIELNPRLRTFLVQLPACSLEIKAEGYICTRYLLAKNVSLVKLRLYPAMADPIETNHLEKLLIM